MTRLFSRIFIVLSILLITTHVVSAQKSGIIRGKVSDQVSGETLIGVTVMVEGTNPLIGTTTDLDGDFSIEHLAPGQYTLLFSYISYTTARISEIQLADNGVEYITVMLEPASYELEAVVEIVAARIDNSENAILMSMKKAESIQDGISAQEMKTFASSNAAESMVKVTGVSVVDGKDIYVRGLGDRYSTVQLDGQLLPGTDPDKNSAQIDLIPANFLENIITSKTFTPDQPGNFTGGNVDIRTRSFPEKFTLNFSMGTSYNDQASLKDNFLSMEGGKTDWLGYDDGTRALPDYLQDTSISKNFTSSFYLQARSSDSLSNILNTGAKSLSGSMAPITKTSPLNQQMSFSAGNQVALGKGDMRLGFMLGGNYRRDYTLYTDGVAGSWELSDANADRLNEYYDLVDVKGVESPKVNLMGKLSLKYSKTDMLEFLVLYNHDADIISRYLYGSHPEYVTNNVFQTRSLHFKEREMALYRATGRNVFENANNMELQYSGSYIKSMQTEPDRMLFANEWDTANNLYHITNANYDLPFHSFRDLTDTQWQGSADLTIPVLQSKHKSNKVKFGGSFSNKNRVYNEQAYEVERRNGPKYDGDPLAYFSYDNMGIIAYDSIRNRYTYGNVIVDKDVSGNSYEGYEQIGAAYAMFSYNFTMRLKVVGGVRYERTDFQVGEGDSLGIHVNDFLPSLNISYALTDNMNLRASYTHTLARPNMRETAPFASFDFIGGVIMNGNPELKRTLIKNMDLRWEYFPEPGELIAVSAYYKDFTDPIIRQNLVGLGNPQVKYSNVDQALVTGLELEFRKNLDVISPALRDFKFGANLSYIYSAVDIIDEEFEIISARNPEFDEPVRPFQGQSPWLVNANIIYSNDSNGINSSLSYNWYAPRLSEVSDKGTPDIYESTYGMFNFVFKKQMGQHFSASFTAKNLLNTPYMKTYTYKGEEYYSSYYQLGRTYGITLTYKID